MSTNSLHFLVTPAAAGGREAPLIDHHGRTYYMDHSTRTIAYNGGGSREDRGRTVATARVSPSRQNPRDIQTRREMLDRRSVKIRFYVY